MADRRSRETTIAGAAIPASSKAAITHLHATNLAAAAASATTSCVCSGCCVDAGSDAGSTAK